MYDHAELDFYRRLIGAEEAWQWCQQSSSPALSQRPCRLCGQFLVHATPNQLLAQLLAATLNQLWTVA